jgi:hypothetical protein
MDVRREKTDIRWVGFYPLQKMLAKDKRSSLFLSGPGKTTYTFSVMFRFLLRLFSVLPAGGGGWVRQGEGRSGRGNGKYIGVSGKRIR